MSGSADRGVPNRASVGHALPGHASVSHGAIHGFAGHGSTGGGRPPETPPALVRPFLARVRVAWRRAVLVRAGIVAAAAGVGVAALLAACDVAYPLPAGARQLLRWLPLLAAAAPLAAALLRVLPGPDDRRLALLVEERAPALENALSTALASLGDGPVVRAFLALTAARLADVDPGAVAPMRVARPAAAFAAAAVAATIVGVVSPGGPAELWRRWSRPAAAPAEAGTAAAAPAVAPGTPVADPRFGAIRVTVTPPAYTRLPAKGWTGDGALETLAGSRIRVEGGFPEGAERVIVRVVGGPELRGERAEAGREEWSAAWTVAAGHRGASIEALRGDDVVARRVIPLTVLPDHPPAVVFVAPDADLVVATPTGEVPLRARASDDFGVETFRLTWIRSRGSGESFSFEEGVLDWAAVRRDGDALVGELALDLAAAGLQPGDVLHLRAVARDGNTATGPGEGYSRTRVIRIARPDEMDQATTLIGFPIEAEKEPILSQRMLILMTERLRDRAPKLGREATLEEALEIAHQQGRLRSRVGDQIFTRATGGMQEPDEGIAFEEVEVAGGGGHGHGHGAGAAGGGGAAGAGAPGSPGSTGPGGAGAPSPEAVLEAASRATGTGSLEEIEHRHDGDPILAVSQPLLDAYNAMWAAERALNQGEPDSALPHQYEALRILQEQRQAERVFLRAKQRVAPVDVAAARGTGKLDEASPIARSPGLPAPTAAPLRAELDALAARLRQGAPGDVALEIAALAARILAHPGADPAAAALVADAARAAGAGDRDGALRLLLRARASLDPAGDAGRAPPLPVATDPVAAEYFRRLGGGRP